MVKRKRSVALIESDSDEDSNSGDDIEAVNIGVVCVVLYDESRKRNFEGREGEAEE